MTDIIPVPPHGSHIKQKPGDKPTRVQELTHPGDGGTLVDAWMEECITGRGLVSCSRNAPSELFQRRCLKERMIGEIQRERRTRQLGKEMKAME